MGSHRIILGFGCAMEKCHLFVMPTTLKISIKSLKDNDMIIFTHSEADVSKVLLSRAGSDVSEPYISLDAVVR
jgi:hypothetical protein